MQHLPYSLHSIMLTSDSILETPYAQNHNDQHSQNLWYWDTRCSYYRVLQGWLQRMVSIYNNIIWIIILSSLPDVSQWLSTILSSIVSWISCWTAWNLFSTACSTDAGSLSFSDWFTIDSIMVCRISPLLTLTLTMTSWLKLHCWLEQLRSWLHAMCTSLIHSTITSTSLASQILSPEQLVVCMVTRPPFPSDCGVWLARLDLAAHK